MRNRVRLRSLVKGAASRLLPQLRNPHKVGGTVSALTSYSCFLRHLVLLRSVTGPATARTVIELGPGSSIGFGLAALLSGAERYIGLDLIRQFSGKQNNAVFDELVELFRARAPVPNDGVCGALFPFLDDHSFPHNVLPESVMELALAPARVDAIRSDLRSESGRFARVLTPWSDAALGSDARADWIVSHSVLEHIDDLAGSYRFFARRIARAGVMTHLIDYSSQGLTSRWNGHWGLSQPFWDAIRGRRHYLINRLPHSTHVEYLKGNGFRICKEWKLRRVDGLLREEFAPEFRSMSHEDATTHLAFLVCGSSNEWRSA
jgi:hypothetical protein